MKGRVGFGSAVVVSMLVLGAAPLAVAQVDWSFEELCVEPGPPGSWDSAGHMLGDVVFDGAVYHMYLTGGQGVNPLDYSWSVGHWTLDPLTQEWEPDQVQGNPVLEPEPGQWDGWGILTVTVLHDGVMFHLWYAAMASYHGPIQVGYASSLDGSVWTKHPDPLPGLGPGDPGGWDDHGTAPHTVLSSGGSYSMWYTAFSGGAWGTWRLGYANSTDGINWDKHPDPVLEGSGGWEDARLYFPAVVPYGSGLAMWYTGAGGGTARIGHAVSRDGLHWGRWPDNPVLSPTPPCNLADSSAVILESGTAHGWVSHCLDIYHVTSPLEVVFFDGFETGDTTIWSAVVP